MIEVRRRVLRLAAMAVLTVAMSNLTVFAADVSDIQGQVSAVDEYRITVTETDFYIGTTTDIPENFLSDTSSLLGRNVDLHFVEFNQVRLIQTLTVLGE